MRHVRMLLKKLVKHFPHSDRRKLFVTSPSIWFLKNFLANLQLKWTTLLRVFARREKLVENIWARFWKVQCVSYFPEFWGTPQKSDSCDELLHSSYLTWKWKFLSSGLLKFLESKQMLLILEKFFQSSNSQGLNPHVKTLTSWTI